MATWEEGFEGGSEAAPVTTDNTDLDDVYVLDGAVAFTGYHPHSGSLCAQNVDDTHALLAHALPGDGAGTASLWVRIEYTGT